MSCCPEVCGGKLLLLLSPSVVASVVRGVEDTEVEGVEDTEVGRVDDTEVGRVDDTGVEGVDDTSSVAE